MCNKKKKAFTLAETLVTLFVIGIIAMLVIPNLLQSIKAQKTLAELKIAYYLLNEAVKQSELDNEETKYWDYSNGDSWAKNVRAKAFSRQYLIPYLKVAYECPNGITNNCFANNNRISSTVGNKQTGYPANYFGGCNDGQDECYSYMFRLHNGMSIAVGRSANIGKTARIAVDLDGPSKGQSMLGEDVFEFVINENGFEPYVGSTHWNPKYYGWKSTEQVYCISTLDSGAQGSGGGRASCAAYIINNGWKFPDDYPYFK